MSDNKRNSKYRHSRYYHLCDRTKWIAT